MQLNKQLILFRYILRQFGYDDFATLREEFNTRETGLNSTGRSYFANLLSSRTQKLIDSHTLYGYDDAIQEYEKRLRVNRAEPFLTLKYYQWFALLFTEFYFDQYAHRPNELVQGLNTFKQADKDFKGIDDYTLADLKKLAYWMATGSGKTLLMHCNYWQVLKYMKSWENIILITPNEGLSKQHYESFTESGIPAKLYSGSEESLKTDDNEVLIIEITKLVKEKSGEGVSVDVDHFSETRNLVFIDEGHKGQKSEEKKWKGLREHITRGEGSFTIEYSATFGQIISTSTKDLLQEYGRAIIFDYSYRHFYSDGYGKDFAVFNIDEKNDYSEEQTRLLLTGNLLAYYEQLELFEKHREELRSYNIEKPLWVFVGSKVMGSSDITEILNYFRFAVGYPRGLQREMDKILEERSGLLNPKGEDIFKGRFTHLKVHRPQADDVIRKVFNGAGGIEAAHVKQADGEIVLKTTTATHHFGVINIGDAPKYAKELEKETEGQLTVQDDNFNKSFFHALSEPSSPINVLIGSKKFIEGWNSWRVSSMGLMNMGKNEGPQIIQLFGRGVRLKGKEFSLKREDANAPYHIRALQTISIVGLNASYMNRFLQEIEKEVPEYEEYNIEIKFNREEDWNNQIMTFKTEEGRDFKQELVQLEYKSEVAKRVTVDLRSKVTVAAGGFNSAVAEDAEGYKYNFLKKYNKFIDFDAIEVESSRFRLMRNYTNLIIHRSVIEQLIGEEEYNLFSHPGQFGLHEAITGRMQDVAATVVKDYISKFYSDKEKAYLTKYLTYERLDHAKHREMFPASRQMIVKVPKGEYDNEFKDLEQLIKELYMHDHDLVPTIHLGNHLYSPIASFGKKERHKDIKTVPAKLNEGETKFVHHLRMYINASSDFEGKDVFVLRNLSRSGIGFFIESSSFYPDFIVWVIDEAKQEIYFLDPKGIRETRHFNDPKIIFCRDQVGELENKINSDLKRDTLQLPVKIKAFILSITAYNDVRKDWGSGTGTTREDFSDNKVLFIEKDLAYLKYMFTTP